jgi:hypothetical protein
VKVVVPYWHGKSKYTYCDDDVIKLHEQLQKHVTDLEFVVYADHDYDIPGRVERLERPGSYQSGIECYKEPGPMMVLGLDTVIRGNIDWLPFDKFRTPKAKGERKPNNGIALVPEGHSVWEDFRFDCEDMLHVRKYVEDTLPANKVASYKWDKWKEADIVYFHGKPKPRGVNWLQ